MKYFATLAACAALAAAPVLAAEVRHETIQPAFSNPIPNGRLPPPGREGGRLPSDQVAKEADTLPRWHIRLLQAQTPHMYGAEPAAGLLGEVSRLCLGRASVATGAREPPPPSPPSRRSKCEQQQQLRGRMVDAPSSGRPRS